MAAGNAATVPQCLAGLPPARRRAPQAPAIAEVVVDAHLQRHRRARARAS